MTCKDNEKPSETRVTWIELIGEHPLQTPWLFIFNEKGSKIWTSKEHFMNRLTAIGKMETIEDFFRAYTYIQMPSEFPYDVELRLFRYGVMPMWEYCPDGGAWIVKVRRGCNINKYWERLIFACIGEQFYTKNVIGAVLSVRQKCYIVQVWVNNPDEDAIPVVKFLEEAFDGNFRKGKIYLKTHHKAMLDNSSSHNTESFQLRKRQLNHASVANGNINLIKNIETQGNGLTDVKENGRKTCEEVKTG